MRVAFLYNEPKQDPAGVAEDCDPEHSPIVAALLSNGHDVIPLSCTLDLESVRRELERLCPEVVFNRVESLGGSDALPAALMLLLDVLKMPYTGCPTQPFLATSDKLAVKQRLQAAGLPTPEWCVSQASDWSSCASLLEVPDFTPPPFPARYILKSVLEHASFAMDDDSVIHGADYEQLAGLVRDAEARWERPYFAERFIAGREFNLAVWGGHPQVLPPAEIDFSAFPAGKPRIVGQRAKFAVGSFEFENTPRRFVFPEADGPLIERLKTLAAESWRLFGLQGYARVDFRCDAGGQPWILEINANPCLAPGSGFAAAWAVAGIKYAEGIEHILEDALRRQRCRVRTESESNHDTIPAH